MTARSLAAALALLAGMTGGVWAQGYPAKPVTIVIPLAAGGAVDRMVRTITEPMRATLGQPILVENVGGAGGTLGVARVARAAPDGYTISIGTWGTHVLNAFVYSPPYDLIKDFEPVALLPNVPQWFIGRKNLPPNTLLELVAWLKANPGKATSGSVGTGGSSTVCTFYFQKATGTTYTTVPYRGGAPALQDIVAGNIDMMCDLAANSLPQVRAGNVKAFAVTAKQRWFAAPQVPTAEEAGVPGLDLSIWHGAWVPKGTPPDIVAKLNAAINRALDDPEVRKRIADQGMNMPPSEMRTPQAFTAYVKAEMEKWGPVVRESGIKAQ
jgi:tripartite-type tricarboxylate transporter receptor subunit TctC